MKTKTRRQSGAVEPLDWARSARPAGDESGGGLWLVLADGLGLGARIVRRLAAEGIAHAMALPGPAFARAGDTVWTLPPGRREDCLSLLTEIGGLPAFVLHLWALGPDDGTSPTDLFARLERSEEAGFRSLVPLLWALSGPAGAAPVRVVVAADRMQRVLRGEAVDPSRSALPTLCETVTAAYPHLLCRTVDLLPPAPGAGRKAWIESTSALLLDEVRHGREPAVAWRGGERWEPIPNEAPETDLERSLAEIWRQLLGGPPVRRRESFFERGGDSRTALLLAERLRKEIGIELQVAELLAAPTVAGLAEAIERRDLTPVPSPIAPPPPGEGRHRPSPPAFPPLPGEGGAMGEGGQGGEVLKIPPADWRLLKERAGQRAVTPAGLVLGAFCDVLATWSERARFAVAVDGAGLVEVDAAAPGGFVDRARAVQQQIWKRVASRGDEPAGWPAAFSFGASSPSAWNGRLRCRAREADGGLTVDWEAPGLPAELSALLLGALRDHLHRLSAPSSVASWSDERRRLIPPQQLARRVHAAGGGGEPVLHVLDDRLEPRPDGVAGTLYRSAPRTARGGKFVIHPDTGEKLFQTGSTARVRPDGTVEIVEGETVSG
jgi:aryl carrier-like protein